MLDLKLITLEGVKLDQSVYEVILPTTDGEIAVFPGHEPLVTVARTGVIAIRRQPTHDDEMLEYFAISGGVIEIDQHSVQVLVDEADSGDEIAEDEVKEALARAIELQKSATSQVELEKAHALVDRHQVRLKVAGLRRRRRS